MDKTVQLVKKVYNSAELQQYTVETFQTFTDPEVVPVEEEIQSFFDLYEKLYHEIDPEGEINSHRYLVNRSSELLTFEEQTLEIEPLLDEIAQLREENLKLNQQLLDKETQV